jgi:hypothetical protein
MRRPHSGRRQPQIRQRVDVGTPASHRACQCQEHAQTTCPPRRRLGVGGVKKGAAQGVTHATAAEFPAQFRLRFDDGSALAVRGRGLIGREPAAGAGKLVAHLVALADDSYSMSRTHLEFDVDENALRVRDCASTNGSELEVNGCCTPLEPGRQVPASAGCRIHIGARQVKVRTITNRWAIGAATIACGAATHVGAVRESNQDAYGSAPPVFVVPDGVGGHVAGDVAAHEAVKALLPLAGHPGGSKTELARSASVTFQVVPITRAISLSIYIAVERYISFGPGI